MIQTLDLIKIIQDDDMGLLESESSSAIQPDDRMIASFTEIGSFIDTYHREPSEEGDMSEYQLANRLKAFREDSEKVKILQPFDTHHLLPPLTHQVTNIADIFADDELGLLQEDADIFTLKYVKHSSERAETDYIARRKPCLDFEEYRAGFLQCHEDISTGKRELNIFFSENDIQENGYFILNGVLVYVAKIQKEFRDKNGKRDGRLHCIFENGTESTMLLRSLGKAMYHNKNGRVVSELLETSQKRLATIEEDDIHSGYIYVVRSLSHDPQIQSIENLYKIGFSTTPVTERVKNALKEPTYLMAPVHVIFSLECYNMNTQKFEQAIHTLLGKYCVNLDIFDEKNKRHSPREWFSVDFTTIEKVIDMIVGE